MEKAKAAQGLAYSFSEVRLHKMLSFQVSISLHMVSISFQVTLPFIKVHTASRHLESTPLSGDRCRSTAHFNATNCLRASQHSIFKQTQVHRTQITPLLRLHFARKHMCIGFSLSVHFHLHDSFHFLARFPKRFLPSSQSSILSNRSHTTPPHNRCSHSCSSLGSSSLSYSPPSDTKGCRARISRCHRPHARKHKIGEYQR